MKKYKHLISKKRDRWPRFGIVSLPAEVPGRAALGRALPAVPRGRPGGGLRELRGLPLPGKVPRWGPDVRLCG